MSIKEYSRMISPTQYQLSAYFPSDHLRLPALAFYRFINFRSPHTREHKTTEICHEGAIRNVGTVLADPQAMAMPLNHCGEYVVSTNGSTLRRTNANTTGLHTGSDNITILTNTSTSTAPNSSQTVLLRDEIEPADYRSLALLFYIVFFVFAMIAIVMFLGLLIATFVKKKCNWRKVKEHRKEKHISKDLEKAEAIMLEKTGD
jgi:hypothetical protein